MGKTNTRRQNRRQKHSTELMSRGIIVRIVIICSLFHTICEILLEDDAVCCLLGYIRMFLDIKYVKSIF
jgi:hypothetical protein